MRGTLIKNIFRSLYYDLPPKIFRGKTLPCRNVVIELTYRCNLSCSMCSIMNEIATREKVKSDVELQSDELLDLIFQLPSGSNITFTGGEVFIKKGIEKISAPGCSYH